MKKSAEVESLFYTFQPIELLKESVDHFVKSQNSLPHLAKSIVAATTAIELAMKNELVELCPALILNSIDDDAGNVISLFKLKMAPHAKRESRELKTVVFGVLFKRLGMFREVELHRHPLTELYKIRNALIHHEAYLDTAKLNYYLLAGAYPFLQELLRDKPGKEFFGTRLWHRLEKLKDRNFSDYEMSLNKQLALHTAVRDGLNYIQRSLARKMQSRPLEYLDENVVADNLFCPSCNEPTFACFFGALPGEGPDGEEMYPYHVFRCRLCSLELDETQIHYLSDNLEKFDLSEKKEEVREWISVTGWESAQDVFDVIPAAGL